VFRQAVTYFTVRRLMSLWALPAGTTCVTSEFESSTAYSDLATKIWPDQGEVTWPPARNIGDDVIEQFVERFNKVTVPAWMAE
jgi:hypothetical protein